MILLFDMDKISLNNIKKEYAEYENEFIIINDSLNTFDTKIRNQKNIVLNISCDKLDKDLEVFKSP